MQIKNELPPIYDEAIKRFPNANFDKGTVFTYGQNLHCSDKFTPPADILVHESVHARQQGDYPREWWQRYFEDPMFRLSQELEAYRTQYKFYCSQNKNREGQHKFAVSLASTLVRLYEIPDLDLLKALNLIKSK